MSTIGKLELTIKINEFPADVKTMESGWKQFEIDISGQIVTLTLKPKVFKKLEQAQEKYPHWVAKITGEMGSTTEKGFLLKDCSVSVYPQSSDLHKTFVNDDQSESFTSQAKPFLGNFHLYKDEIISCFHLILHMEKAVFLDILPWIIYCCAYGFLISVLYYLGLPLAFPSRNILLTVVLLSFNIGLPLLLIFQANTANKRFWKSRKLWEALVNTVHHLTRDVWIAVIAKQGQERLEKEATLRLGVAFAVATKLHLRAEPVNDELMSLLSETQCFRIQQTNHPPLQIAFWIGDYLQNQHERNYLSIYQLASLQRFVDDLVDILVGCERILKTPLPFKYGMGMRKLVLLYCLIFPLQIVSYFPGWTSIITAFVSFILLSIEQIGWEIENPFGHKQNNLPLDGICNTLIHDLEELITLAYSSDCSR